MKKILFIFSLILIVSCEKPSECFESAGEIVTKEVPVTDFTRIEVHTGIELVITQGDVYSVVIKTGQNLIDNIEVKQDGNTIYLTDNTKCNLVREFGQTIVYVTAPNLEDIYSKTDRNISSNGVLTYPILRLFSLDFDGDGKDGAGSGDFYFSVNNSQVVIQNNNVSRYFIAGTTDELLLDFYFGDGRFSGENLLAQNIKLFHRGSNDMIINPIQSVSGKLVSTGNVILKNNPPINTLEAFYQGQIIYN